MSVIPGEDPGSSVDHLPLQRAAVRHGSRLKAGIVSVIPGEDPGSSVDHLPLQRAAVRHGSRLKAGMTIKDGRDDNSSVDRLAGDRFTAMP